MEVFNSEVFTDSCISISHDKFISIKKRFKKYDKIKKK